MINNNIYDGDLKLFNRLTHSDIVVEDGQAAMDPGLENSIYISLFSGDDNLYWFNQFYVNEPDNKIGGSFETLAQGVPLTMSNVLRLEKAILKDLQWMINLNIAKSVNVSSEIQGNTYIFTITVTKPDKSVEQFQFSNNWDYQIKG